MGKIVMGFSGVKFVELARRFAEMKIAYKMFARNSECSR
jgi:hypothetical protein